MSPRPRTVRPSPREALPWLLLAALLGLLVVLGGLQMRWLSRVAEADEERTRAALESAASRFARELDGELVRLAFDVSSSLRRPRPPSDELGASEPAAALAGGVERWRQLAPFPDLLAAVYVLEPAAVDGARVLRLAMDDAIDDATVRENADVARFERATVDPTHPLAGLVDALGTTDPSDPAGPDLAGRVFVDDLPGLVLPLGRSDRRVRRLAERRRRLGLEPPRAPEDRALVLLLDADVLRDEVLPALAVRAFDDGSGDDLPVRVRVLDREPRRTIWEAGPPVPVDASVDVRQPLYGAFLDAGFADADRPPFGRGAERFRRSLLDEDATDAGRWVLEVVHPAGSLDAAVARARRSNTALGLGVLVLLGTSAAFLALAAVRARRLAARQLDFLAAVTHELLTPLSAVRAAGQNLAAGIVREPEQIERYGTTIDREAARLTGTVQRVLAFAGGAGGRRQWRPRPVDPLAAIREAVDVLRPAIDAAGATVTVIDEERSADPPPVHVDPEALALALHNLLGNALKYGRAADGSLEIRTGATPTRDGRRVALFVADRGPGVDPRDRRDLFAPFTRGRDLAASAVAGSGLGLALVDQVARAHGGRVALDSSHPDRPGAVFVLELPRADEPDDLAEEDPR